MMSDKMQFLNYFFASIISFSGLMIGMLLVRIAPEEQKPLGKNFSLARKIFLLLIFIFVLFYYFKSLLNFTALTAYFIFLLFIEHKMDDSFKKSMLVYATLGVIFFLSSKNINLFIIESSLILLYGLPAASLMYNRRGKNKYDLLLYNLVFVIIANVLYFV